jgi:hypothetical protein
MTKKAVLAGLATALIFCAPASANTLPLKTARSLAKRLAAKQVRTRAITSVRLGRGVRVNAREIRFAYQDRSAQNVLCTSAIVVKLRTPTSRIAKATFDTRHTACRPIPADALAFEAATREAVRGVGAQKTALERSFDAFDDSERQCRRLDVPRNRHAQVELFEEAAASSAIFKPIDAPLQTFVNALATTPSSDPTLTAGAAGWTDALALLRSLPDFQPTLCAALKRWAAAGWAASAAPADASAIRALIVRAGRDEKAMERAGKHLATLGVFRQTAAAFTPDGLLAAAFGDFD